MKTVITLKDGVTIFELIAENEFEQNFLNDFDFDRHDHNFYKSDKQTSIGYAYSYDRDKKLQISFTRKAEQKSER